jgi:predicted ATP-grasp superfamily ATP-dependent carboligase
MAVLQALTRVLDLQVDLSGLRELAVRTEKEVDRNLLELQSQKEEEKKPTDSEGPTTVH